MLINKLAKIISAYCLWTFKNRKVLAIWVFSETRAQEARESN
jgi:hypothetical protein